MSKTAIDHAEQKAASVWQKKKEKLYMSVLQDGKALLLGLPVRISNLPGVFY